MKDIEKAKSRITEDLAILYLRLNGYFTTGFMLHSPEVGKIQTEIDCIGVRFPHSAEYERGIGPDAFLNPSAAHIDLVLCEVKRGKEPLQFNKAVRKDVERFERVLRWAGLFTDVQIEQLALEVMRVLTPQAVASVTIPEVIFQDRVRIRGLVFAPDRDVAARKPTQPFFVGGDKIFDYAWRCLCPRAPRLSCATVYDYTSWGYLEPIVRYFKEHGGESAGTVDDLFKVLLGETN